MKRVHSVRGSNQTVESASAASRRVGILSLIPLCHKLQAHNFSIDGMGFGEWVPPSSHLADRIKSCSPQCTQNDMVETKTLLFAKKNMAEFTIPTKVQSRH